MRLLRREDVNDYRLTDKLLDRDLPRYGILSHTWGREMEEVTFEDVGKGAMSEKIGYSKIKFCAEQAAQDGLDHFWIDSCCINRSSSPELSEAIISMFRWYSRAAKCYVYLSDVSVVANGVQQPQEKWEAAFRASKWFTRGWTLQELLAPKLVEFYSCEGKRLGDRESLKLLVQEITRIDVQALQGVPLSRFDVDDRIAWASRRATKLEEDEAYSLIGMFGVSMGPRYGEGRESALSGLHNKIDRTTSTGRMGPPSKRLRTDSHIAYDDRILPSVTGVDLFDPSQIGRTSTSPSRRDLLRSLKSNKQVEAWIERNYFIGDMEFFDELDSIEDEVLQEKCLKGLDVTDARARLENVETPFEDTYSWLFQNRVGFEDWLSGCSRSSIYWIQGKPGSGKSTVMKYAMQNKKTHHLLARYHQNDWIIAGFFFHDRGSTAQKSLSSMLREVMFEILRKRCHLIRPLLSLNPGIVGISGSGDEKSLIVTWKQEDIEKALPLVTALEQLNLCLFIDALDEHEGNHRTLLAAINRLQELCDHQQFCLRLCLSSRPENVFQQAFQTCPGFAIHAWTKQDILKYTQKRFEDTEIDAANQFDELVEEISEKACGVFLWVKLVVDELVEGMENGDNSSELTSMLAIMPPELEGLYERTLRRPVRSGIEVGRKYKRDAFIMFQIALCTETPLELDVFLSIANHASSNASQDDKLTFEQKRRRLHSRCFGLLEVVPAIGHDTGRSDIENVNEVQFIHQTAKSFFMTKKGFDILLADLDDIPDGNGHTYILQHSVSTIIGGDPSGKFLIHSHNAEMTTRRPSISYIIRELQGREEPLQSLISRLLRAEEVAPKLLETLTNVGNNDLSLLVISACACLPLSAAECLKSLGHRRRRYAGISLRATISDTDYHGISNFDATQEILKSMLKTGMDADSIFTNGETPFATLIHANNDDLFYDDVFSDTEQKTRLLSTLVHYGADPNQMIATYDTGGILAPGLHHVLHGPSPKNLLPALLSFGADVSLPDSKGYLALFYAIAFDERECVRILLRNHARVCHINALGLCALAPAPEDFGLRFRHYSFELFESRCLLFNDLFLEAGVNHVETCKYFRGERGEVT